MIGFKLSTDTENLVTPDSVELTLYYIDGIKSSTTLSQGPDGYYLGDNAFGADDNVKEALVSAYSFIDGTSVSTQQMVKKQNMQGGLQKANQSPQPVLDLLR